MKTLGIVCFAAAVWFAWPVLAAPTQIVTPCVTVTSNTSGVTLESCVPVSATSPLPVGAAPSSSASAAVGHSATSALASSLVLKASAGNLYSINATSITGGSAGFLVAINASTVPTNGTAITPLDFCYFNSLAGCSLSHGNLPVNYSTGIVVLVTTAASPFTYTTGVDTAAISGDFQ